MQFPTLVYKDGGPHQRKGGTFDYQQVDNEQEQAAAIKAGWFPSVEEAAAAGKLNEATKTVSKAAAKKAAEEAKALEEAAAAALAGASKE